MLDLIAEAMVQGVYGGKIICILTIYVIQKNTFSTLVEYIFKHIIKKQILKLYFKHILGKTKGFLLDAFPWNLEQVEYIHCYCHS